MTDLRLLVPAGFAWLGRGLPVLDRILLMEFSAVALLAPFAAWIAADSRWRAAPEVT